MSRHWKAGFASGCAAAAALSLAVAASPSLEPKGRGHTPDRLLVRFEPGMDQATIDDLNARVDATVAHSYRLVDGLKLIALPPGIDLEGARALYRRHPRVRYADRDFYMDLAGVPNDPWFGDQWALNNTGQTGGQTSCDEGQSALTDFDIDAPEAWDNTSQPDSPEIQIAVIDTGVKLDHEDLAARIWKNTIEQFGTAGVDDDGNGYVDDVRGWDFFSDDNDPSDLGGHGTHVAGIALAVRSNARGIAGVGGPARIMALKFGHFSSGGTTAMAIEAIEYAAAKGAEVINASFCCGSCTTGGTCPSEEVNALHDAVAAADAAGVLFVAAAGNAGGDSDTSPIYPAALDNDNVISVASVNRAGDLSTFSNYGDTTVDLGAPGEDIVSTNLPTTGRPALYICRSGTSMASPLVAGVAAHLFGIDPTATHDAVKADILAGAVHAASLEGVTVTEAVLNMNRAVNELACGAPACCGNNVVDDPEEVCDGSHLDGETCQSQGFDAGTLTCGTSCAAFDTSACWTFVCGNDICEPADGEDCLSCPQDCNGVQTGNPANRYCCGDGAGQSPVGCGDSRCTGSGNTCY